MKNKFFGCRISLDGETFYCSSFKTQKENLWGAWMRLYIAYGGEYIPNSMQQFIDRGGKIEWFYSIGSSL